MSVVDQMKNWLALILAVTPLLTNATHADSPGAAISKPAVFDEDLLAQSGLVRLKCPT